MILYERSGGKASEVSSDHYAPRCLVGSAYCCSQTAYRPVFKSCEANELSAFEWFQGFDHVKNRSEPGQSGSRGFGRNIEAVHLGLDIMWILAELDQMQANAGKNNETLYPEGGLPFTSSGLALEFL